MPENTEEDMVRVSCGKLVWQLFCMGVGIPLTSYYTFSYTTLSGAVIDTYEARVLLAYIIVAWACILDSFVVLRCIIAHYGATMSINRFDELRFANRPPLSLLKLAPMAGFILAMVLMVHVWGSITKCGVFSGYHYACVSARIIIVVGYFAPPMIPSAIHFYDYWCKFNRLPVRDNDSENNSVNDSVRAQSTDRNFFWSYLPVSTAPPKDNTCSICYNGQCLNDTWKELPCAHKFHPICIDGWFSRGHTTCPLCRADASNVYNTMITV
jgi:hypothetical protein